MIEKWYHLANCKGLDVELFYQLNENLQFTHKAALKRLCERCPVREECLSTAILEAGTQKDYGFRGGLTPDEREAKARAERLSERER